MIIDSGVAFQHEDFNPQIAGRCVDGTLPVWDRIGHGTHVAGIAAAVNNNLDVVGVGHNVVLMSANTEVNGAPSAAEIACSISLARINGVFAANMSLGIAPSTAVTDQIRGGYNNDGMIFVASAGNTWGGAVSYPANLAEVIAVTATDSNNAHPNFAAVGPELAIAAPGVDILSTSLSTGSLCTTGGLIAYCSGTSMAAPHVTAAAALIKAAHPTFTNVDVRNRLTSTALPLGATNMFGAGLLQTAAAVR